MKFYNDYATYLKSLYSERLQKISINCGFSCPNRDGSKGSGGCTFCNNETFTPPYCNPHDSISQQIDKGINFFKHKYGANCYLAYFQSYSNTYAPIEDLKQKFDEALSCDGVVGLIIGTRPDCVSDEILDYLSDVAQTNYVALEYGVESMSDDVLRNVNRGHGVADSVSAIERSANRGITICAHMILGLLGESKDDMIKGVVDLCKLPINVLKLHQLQIVEGTPMALDYRVHKDRYSLFEMQEYLDLLVEIIGKIPDSVMLERFVNQTPDRYLVAPHWGIKNYEFVEKLNKALAERNIWQGKNYQR